MLNCIECDTGNLGFRCQRLRLKFGRGGEKVCQRTVPRVTGNSVETGRAIVYVDGFNFYNGCFGHGRGDDWKSAKWLDLETYLRNVYSHFEIVHIHYFTALVVEDPENPDARTRQETYWRALRTLESVSIHKGVFYKNDKRMPLAKDPKTRVLVTKVEEKQTDVHIASRMLLDAFQNRGDVSILVSNDSDLSVPVRILKTEFDRSVLVLNPHAKPAWELKQSATEIKQVRLGPLLASQFPYEMSDENGDFTIPETWRPVV